MAFIRIKGLFEFIAWKSKVFLKLLVLLVKAFISSRVQHMGSSMFNFFNLKKFLGLTMIIVGIVLISIEIHTYFVTKPTSVEFKDDIRLTSKYLPEIIFCPRPAFNLKAMQQKGFKGRSLYSYHTLKTQRFVLLGTFELFMGNIGFSSNETYKGWGSLKNLKSTEIGDLYSSLSNIEDLVKSIFLVSVGKDELIDVQFLKPFYLPLSYPDGKCFSVEFKRDDSVPLEFGIVLNKTILQQNNIIDLDILLKDPLNSVGFLSPKVYDKLIT